MRTSITRYITIICLTLLSLQSCIEEYDAVLPDDDINLLVVEGTIISGETCQFYLSKSQALSTEEYHSNHINAKLTIIGSDGLNLNVPQAADRSYRVSVPVLNPEAEYSLQIEWEDDIYQSVPQKPFPSTPIEKVEFDQPDKHRPINILLTTSVPKNPKETQYYRWTFEETWEVQASFKSNVQWNPITHKGEPLEHEFMSHGWCSAVSRDIIASSSAYYNNNQIVKYNLYNIPTDNRRLQVLYSTLVKQRSISKEEYEYENERRRISQEMGGLFTPQPSVLPSNIHCTTSSRRAIGYVGCSAGYQTQRLFIDRNDVNTDLDLHCKAYYSSDSDYPGDEKLFAQGFYLFMYAEDPNGSVDRGWTTFGCLDVSRLGATTYRPSFWPTDK